jgi:hypothetical protein
MKYFLIGLIALTLVFVASKLIISGENDLVEGAGINEITKTSKGNSKMDTEHSWD